MLGGTFCILYLTSLVALLLLPPTSHHLATSSNSYPYDMSQPPQQAAAYPPGAYPPGAQAGYPPGAGAYPPGAQAGYPQQGMYPPGAQAGYPPGAAAYPPGAQAGYPPGGAAYPPGAYPPGAGGYPAQAGMGGYPPMAGAGFGAPGAAVADPYALAQQHGLTREEADGALKAYQELSAMDRGAFGSFGLAHVQKILGHVFGNYKDKHEKHANGLTSSLSTALSAGHVPPFADFLSMIGAYKKQSGHKHKASKDKKDKKDKKEGKLPKEKKQKDKKDKKEGKELKDKKEKKH